MPQRQTFLSISSGNNETLEQSLRLRVGSKYHDVMCPYLLLQIRRADFLAQKIKEQAVKSQEILIKNPLQLKFLLPFEKYVFYKFFFFPLLSP